MKRPPSSDHQVGNGQVDQVEVDRRPHRLVEDHLEQDDLDDLKGDLTSMLNKLLALAMPSLRESHKAADFFRSTLSLLCAFVSFYDTLLSTKIS